MDKSCKDIALTHRNIMHSIGRKNMPQAFETVAKAALPKGDQLYRAMHELEALQDKRQGKDAPLARMQVHGPAA